MDYTSDRIEPPGNKIIHLDYILAPTYNKDGSITHCIPYKKLKMNPNPKQNSEYPEFPEMISHTFYRKGFHTKPSSEETITAFYLPSDPINLEKPLCWTQILTTQGTTLMAITSTEPLPNHNKLHNTPTIDKTIEQTNIIAPFKPPTEIPITPMLKPPQSRFNIQFFRTKIIHNPTSITPWTYLLGILNPNPVWSKKCTKKIPNTTIFITQIDKFTTVHRRIYQKITNPNHSTWSKLAGNPRYESCDFPPPREFLLKLLSTI